MTNTKLTMAYPHALNRASAISIILFFLLLSLSQCSSNDDDIVETTFDITADIVLPNQKAVDSFAKVYQKYRALNINGNVVIGKPGLSDINNLQTLEKIKSINGNLGILGTVTLNSLTGLENLKTINNLYIEYNQSLVSLNGLGSLETVNGFLFIEINDKLSDLGLSKLEQVKGSLKFNNGFNGGSQPHNDVLTTISLPVLKKIGGDLDLTNIIPVTSFNFPKLDTINGSVGINQGNKLADFTGLDALVHIGGELSITQNAVTSFKGFNKLKSIGSILRINSNPNITNLSGFTNLRDVGQYIQITNNNNLTALSGLEALRTATILDIQHNPKLTNFCAIKPLIQNMLLLYPSTSPLQIILLYDNSTTLPEPYTHSNVINNCP